LVPRSEFAEARRRRQLDECVPKHRRQARRAGHTDCKEKRRENRATKHWPLTWLERRKSAPGGGRSRVLRVTNGLSGANSALSGAGRNGASKPTSRARAAAPRVARIRKETLTAVRHG